ncbi:lipopolysaccharide kinase InaA family protein [Natronospira bacteriovora]|uniref:Lipopolysaccharide kinase InaA family protein n=1 Tax=Natronospira bacteriovora TaxID=3069753 RepID=A0ABU0W3I4_9GAMM|nr:lipopolysaccharide kinase InaA family protein [Natronospira sp. AB-CW4]MDQ2068568.1 lipopolysaccharide kinase InaA family protein [Natronospira sp. AB-CW4]
MSRSALTERFREELVHWAREAERTDRHYLSKGYQGRVLLYESESHRLVIKTPPAWWPYRWLSRRMLRHEAAVYQHLEGLDGIPVCHGLLDDAYLVLDYIDGPCLRDTDIQNRDAFYRAFIGIIRRMHAAGVGHADLKRKDNILVGPGEKPWLIDFGVAVIRKRGFHPINHFLFNTARRFDLNAWIKHKYRRNFREVSDRDRRFLQLTWMERAGRRIKRSYRKLWPRKRRQS